MSISTNASKEGKDTMTDTINNTAQNPLATEPIGKLIAKFAIPAIISFLVSAIYNIVDQIFIGQGVGLLGNAATNVAFPLTTISTAIALLIGVGSASNFNLRLGEGHKDKAGHIAGTGITLMIAFGVTLAVVVIAFLDPLLMAFGSTPNVLPYAQTYTGITTLGIPFIILTTGGSQLVRADGSPGYSMACLLSGAILNTILDPVLIFGANMGIAGGAIATVLGQILSAVMVILYFRRFKTLKLTKKHLRPHWSYAKMIFTLGMAACFNQLALTAVQITMNNTLTYYGGLSHYGSEIPLAVVGIITKVNILFLGFAIGVAQGCQPIVGFNYGARNYERVKKTFSKATVIVLAISIAAFLAFQLFPRQIVSAFGEGSEDYFEFAERYFRIFMLLTFANGMQPLISNFFTSIGKATRGILLSLTRQIIFLLPLILIFPIFWGIDGVMYAGPIADGAAAILAVALVIGELRNMEKRDPRNRAALGTA